MEELALIKRRDFLRSAFWAGTGTLALGAFPFDVLAGRDLVKITILHTNDVHSHIEPFPDNDPRFGGLGGVARRAALIKRIRNEEKNVLLFDAGDIYQGTYYFNKYGGELELKLMSEMGYDASAIGNHDFDNGIEGITSKMHFAKFPLLCANYDFSNTDLKGKVFPYKIFMKDGVKIGVFGLGIELEGLVGKKHYGDTVYLDPIKKAAEHAILLKEEMKCDLVICLSHLGFRYDGSKVSDIVLAKQSRHIDVIIGGHTHTFLDKPSVYTNRDGKPIHICQVGWAGIRLGRIDFYMQRGGGKKNVEGTSYALTKIFDHA
jgi:5'-nucleotidase